MLSAEGKLLYWEKETNPGEFSQQDYYRLQKIDAYLWCEDAELDTSKEYLLREWLNTVRLGWNRRLTEAAGQRYGGILGAILLGEKKGMDPNVRELYQINGIAHILAISGLHLSFAGMGVYRLIRRITGSYFGAGVIGMLFLLLYILMIGATISAVRAVVMFCFRIGADMSGRVNDMPTSVAVAAAVAVGWRPLSFYDAGFQLSFGAVCGMLFVYPVVSESKMISMKKKGKMKGIFEGFMRSLCVQMTTLPVILWHYYEMPGYGIVLNLIVIPMMSVLMFSGLAGSFLSLFLMEAGKPLFLLSVWILKFYGLLCSLAQKLPGQRLITGKPELSGVALYYLFFLIFLILVKKKAKRKKPEQKHMVPAPAIPLFVGIISLLMSCPAISNQGLEVTFLDVGQGDGNFIREERGLTFLIDGGSSDVSEVGKYRIERFLKARGVSRLDYVFVTHGDQDHIGGIIELMERQEVGIEIGCIVFPDPAVWEERLTDLYQLAVRLKIPALWMEKGQTISGKNLMIRCLGPDTEAITQSGNEASLILQVSYGELNLLYTGDVEGVGEECLTERLNQTFQVLKVAHHGSSGSTGERFLRAAGIQLAIISSGRNNPYGHPHRETLERLEYYGVFVLCTAQTGAVTLTMKGKEVENLKIIQYNKSYEKFE